MFDIKITDWKEGHMSKEFVEDCWFIYGFRLGFMYVGWCVYQVSGTSGGVDFDYEKALDPRIIGWYHTHPGKRFTTPSPIDEKTMRSWVRGNGRDMLCGIRCGEEQECYRFYRSPNVKNVIYSRLVSFLYGSFFVGFKTMDYQVSL